MYNQEIHLFFTDLIQTQFENIENIKTKIEYIFNALNCLKGFFQTNNQRENNIKMPLISSDKGDESMKFKGKTIFKNKTCNTWYTRYRADGKQYYISGKTQNEVLKELKNRLNYIPQEKRKYKTLLEWYQEWLKLFKIGNVKDNTISDYEKTLKNIKNEILNKNIKNITAIEIIQNLDEIKKERTKQKTYELLNAIFFKAKQYKIINENVMDIIEKPKHIREKGIALTNEQQKILIEKCKLDRYGDIILITLYQGLRIGEVLALTGEDINLENLTLRINKAINKDGDFDTTKNNQSNRTMPIFKNSVNILKKYIHLGKERIFDLSYNVPQKHLKAILKLCELSTEISLHDLRHTFITNCKNANIPEHIIQSWVGHEIGSKVTSAIYTHVNKEDTLLYLEKYNNSI